MNQPIDRRAFLAATSASLAGIALAQDAKDDGPKLTHGPFLTHFDTTSVSLWARASKAGEYRLDAREGRWQHSTSATATASDDNDFTLRWSLSGLAASAYDVTVRVGDRVVHSASAAFAPAAPGETTTVVIGSCADERKFADQPVWDRMRDRKPGLVTLIGDTPYIDSTDLAKQRERYRAFYSQPQLAALLREFPFAGVWDDHDFAGNDLFGAVEGRDNSRRAFLEYHGEGRWGEDGNGVYSRRRVGPIELFLLDTRWFADTEPSPFDAAKKTLLGKQQLRWLQSALTSSDAPFKVLASGMIWNDAVRPGKRDWWGNWPHERDGLFRWLGEKKIRGAVLVGGDIHRTRVVQHATKDVVGYDLLEFITSPIANTVIDAADTPHPGLLFDRGAEQSFLCLTTRPDTGSTLLIAEHLDGAGKELFRLERYAFTLAAK